ncbi:MAG: glutaredoxin family protein [uncultured bacterium]|nr:MAG: glutaredoxin family protein [uncultured bacterium]
MGLQVFGTKKCKDTQKAERFFKERRINFHFVDLKERAVTKGELEHISEVIPLEDLLDKEGKLFSDMNLKYINYNAHDILLEHPLLFKTPIVRMGRTATCGYKPEIWKTWQFVV